MTDVGTFLPCQPRRAMVRFQGQSSCAAEILRRQRLTPSDIDPAAFAERNLWNVGRWQVTPA